jgi:hypothetical protein
MKGQSMDLTTEQQSYAILKATELKLVSANKIDPESAGTGITRMKRGANVSANIIARRYHNLLNEIGQDKIAELLQCYPSEQGVVKELPKDKEQAAKPAEWLSKVTPEVLQAEVKKLQAELEAAHVRIAELETENRELQDKLSKLPEEPLKIEGWSIVQRKAGGAEHRYWYAGKSIGGKMQWLYLGKELDIKAAREKIETEKEKKK